MSDRPIAGFECALFYKDGANWNEIKNAKDVSLPDSTEAIDVSARYSAAKKYIAGMSDGSIEFGYQYIKGTDPVFDALQARYLSREPIEIAAADGAIAENGTVYSRDWYVVTKFERTEELGGSRVYSVTLQPTVVFESGNIVERSFHVVGAP
jgi:hypothetical protein